MNDFIVTIGKDKKEVIIHEDNKVSIGGKDFDYELTPLNAHAWLLKLNDKTFHISAEKINNDTFSVYLNGKYFETKVRSALQEKAIELLEQKASHNHKTEIKAPMPGMILKIKKNVGEEISRGESIIILEAMKMENDIHSPAQGIIKSISVKEGSPVEKGAVLFSIE